MNYFWLEEYHIDGFRFDFTKGFSNNSNNYDDDRIDLLKRQARKFGVTKFGLERFVFGFLDLFSITFIGKYGKRPMHLFGTLGTLVFVIGFMFLFYIGIDKVFFNKGAKLIANRTEFYIALTSIIIGVQFFLAGFIGEMLSRTSPNRNSYHIKEKLNINE